MIGKTIKESPKRSPMEYVELIILRSSINMIKNVLCLLKENIIKYGGRRKIQYV